MQCSFPGPAAPDLVEVMNPPASRSWCRSAAVHAAEVFIPGILASSAGAVNEPPPGTEAGGRVGEVIRLLGAAARFHAGKLVELPHAVRCSWAVAAARYFLKSWATSSTNRPGFFA